MTAQAVKTINRTLPFIATWTSSPDILTVTTVLPGTSTPTPHYLKNGDKVSFILKEVTAEANNLTVTYVSANVFTVPMSSFTVTSTSGFVKIPYFSAGQTGEQEIFTITPSAANHTSIIQLTARGTGGAVIVVNASNDKLGWVVLSTITLASSNLATDFVLIANNWNYCKLSITSIGASTDVVVTVAS